MLTFVTKSAGRVTDQRTLDHLLSHMPNGEYAFTIEPKAQWRKRQGRSTKQNSLLWAYLGDIALLLNQADGGDCLWNAQRLHDFFCSVFATDDVSPSGMPYRKPLRTSSLTVAQMSELLQRIQMWLSANLGMSIPLPGDDDYNDFKQMLNGY